MPNVWLVQKISHQNYVDAERFGVLKYIFDRYENVFNPSEIFKEAHDMLKAHATDEDYLILNGNAVLSGLTLLAYCTLFSKNINILIFNAKQSKYEVGTLDLWD